MKHPAFVILPVVLVLFTGHMQQAAAQTDDVAASQKLELTPAERSAIYATVSKDKSKVAPQPFSTKIGADVPPMIELYSLPDQTVAENPAAKLYEYTIVENEVVVVDPTRMRIVDRIGPAPDR
ncbi:MAG: DUF1236 domain-containing protein [Xanthobacteraceae bacterium]|jgi:hypothetical protein